MDKKSLSERDICTKFITPALRKAGWDEMMQIREEVSFTKGRIIVRGKLVSRGAGKRADYILYYKPNVPIALIEAKDNTHAIGDGMQQGLDYAETLKIPFVFSSNGDGFVFHDRTGASAEKETTIDLDAFPSPGDLWARYRAWKGLTPEAEAVVLQDYFDDGGGKAPRYYQINAINAAIEAIAKGGDRILLVMATGTGKTYTAFQIIWRLWKAGRKKRILFLADRNVLVDQTMVNDFRPFGAAMAKLSTKAKTIERADGSSGELTRAIDGRRRIDTAYEIYLGLYQAITGPEEHQKIFREFSPGFFDLIVIDECHRGSAAEDSAWREILEYFSSATQIGLTATPKETRYVSNIDYFGPPVYTYSLKQGIRDGFLAPYKVVKVHIDRDVEGYRPEKGQLDRAGNERSRTASTTPGTSTARWCWTSGPSSWPVLVNVAAVVDRHGVPEGEREPLPEGDRLLRRSGARLASRRKAACARRSSTRTPTWWTGTTATSCARSKTSPATTRKGRRSSTTSSTRNRSTPCWSPRRGCCRPASTCRPRTGSSCSTARSAP